MSRARPTTTSTTSETTPTALTGASGVVSSPPGRGRPRHPDTDRAILATTFAQLVDVGYGGLSIESVAAVAGVAKTTIYRRYPTKRDLVVAALRAGTPFPEPPSDLDARSALLAFVRGVAASLVATGAFRILGSLLVEDQREPGLLEEFRQRILRPRLQVIQGLLQRGIERGEIRPDIDPLIVIEMLAGAIFGHHAILGLEGTDEWTAGLVDHVWHAIAAPDRR